MAQAVRLDELYELSRIGSHFSGELPALSSAFAQLDQDSTETGKKTTDGKCDCSAPAAEKLKAAKAECDKLNRDSKKEAQALEDSKKKAAEEKQENAKKKKENEEKAKETQ